MQQKDGLQQAQSPFHESEIAVQKRLGLAELVAKYSQGFIRKAMPQQHRQFFCELPMVILGVVDQGGYPWAMPLFGEKGFIQSFSNISLSFNSLPQLIRVLDLDFRVGQKIGMLGIQLENRRRNRVNGRIDELSESGFSIHVEQSFGNCPQYIQTRELIRQKRSAVPCDFNGVKVGHAVSKESAELIQRADTFFIASRTGEFSDDWRSGIDASHRGGKPGFVKVEGNTVYFPDFSGNRFFNTLGNIESDGRVGLFFPDFSTGDSVFLAGRAEVYWEHEAVEKLEGAERMVAVYVERVVRVPGFMGMTGELIEHSPVLDRTGIW